MTDQIEIPTLTNWQRAKMDIRRLEIANEVLVKKYAELHLKYTVVSALMRRFARMRSINRWAERITGADSRYAYLRTMKQLDRQAKALIDKPWEDVT